MSQLFQEPKIEIKILVLPLLKIKKKNLYHRDLEHIMNLLRSD